MPITYLLLKRFLFISLTCLVAACNKDKDSTPAVTQPTGPVSFYNLEFRGKKYKEVSDSITFVQVDTLFIGNNPKTGKREYQLQIYWPGKNLTLSAVGRKDDTTTATGTYVTTLTGYTMPRPVSSALSVLVLGDTTFTYMGAETSSINVTSADNTGMKGTINFTLFSNSGSFPATGDFEIYK